MNTSHVEPGTQQPSRVFYTCWPFGGLLRGISTIGLGILRNRYSGRVRRSRIETVPTNERRCAAGRRAICPAKRATRRSLPCWSNRLPLAVAITR